MAPKGFEADEEAPKPKEPPADAGAGWPKGELLLVEPLPNPKPLSVGFDIALPFMSIPAPRTGLSSMLTSAGSPFR